MKNTLLLLSCFVLAAMPLFSQPSTDKISNMYDYEKVIVLELTATGDKWDMEVKKICQGIPTKSVVSDRSIKMDFLEKGEKVMYSVSVGNPKLLHLHSQHNAVPAERDFPASITVIVPYDEKCTKVVCTKEKEIESPTAWKKTFNIKQGLKEANQAFDN